MTGLEITEVVIPDSVDAPNAADSAETRLLQSLGYRLEQVERGSWLPLPVDEASLEAMRAQARDAAGGEYRIHTWTDATPPEWREDIAHLLTRMSTDAPSAGLEESEDPWTVERLLADEALEAENPSTALVAAVEHVPSGRLAGFTELLAPRTSPARSTKRTRSWCVSTAATASGCC